MRPPVLQRQLVALVKAWPGITARALSIRLGRKPTNLTQPLGRAVAKGWLRFERGRSLGYRYGSTPGRYWPGQETA